MLVIIYFLRTEKGHNCFILPFPRPASSLPSLSPTPPTSPYLPFCLSLSSFKLTILSFPSPPYVAPYATLNGVCLQDKPAKSTRRQIWHWSDGDDVGNNVFDDGLSLSLLFMPFSYMIMTRACWNLNAHCFAFWANRERKHHESIALIARANVIYRV